MSNLTKLAFAEGWYNTCRSNHLPDDTAIRGYFHLTKSAELACGPGEDTPIQNEADKLVEQRKERAFEEKYQMNPDAEGTPVMDVSLMKMDIGEADLDDAEEEVIEKEDMPDMGEIPLDIDSVEAEEPAEEDEEEEEEEEEEKIAEAFREGFLMMCKQSQLDLPLIDQFILKQAGWYNEPISNIVKALSGMGDRAFGDIGQKLKSWFPIEDWVREYQKLRSGVRGFQNAFSAQSN